MYKKHIICILNIISTLQYITAYCNILWQVSRLNGRHKSCMKKCLEFENNAVGHMTFSGQLTCQPGP